MINSLYLFRLGSYVAHVVCLVAITILTMQYPGPMTVYIVVGTLIGLASVTTVKHRIVPLFVSFGLMLGPLFWSAVGSINMRLYLGLIPPILMVVGVGWTLKKPNWISAAFTAATVVMMLLLCRYAYTKRFGHDFWEPDEIIASVTIIATFVSLSLLELSMGVGIKMTTPVKRKTRKQNQAVVSVGTGSQE